MRDAPTAILRAALLLAALAGAAAPASGQQRGAVGEAEAADLRRVVDDRWVGGQRGGYWPVRVALENRGAARAVTCAFVPDEPRRGGGRMPLVTRTLAAPAGAALTFTLPVPLTAGGGGGELVFLADPLPDGGAVAPTGRDADDLRADAIPELTHEVHPPRADDEPIRRPAVLITEGSAFDGEAFGTAADTVTMLAADDAARPEWRRAVSGDRDDRLTLPPAALPDTWLGYTTVDLVVTDAARLGGLSEPVREALITWLHAGGAIVVVRDGTEEDGAAISPKATRLLGLDAVAAAGGWEPAEPDRAVLRGGAQALLRRAGEAVGQEFPGSFRPSPPYEREDPGARAALSGAALLLLRGGGTDAADIARRSVLGGRVYAMTVEREAGGGESGGWPATAGWLAVLSDLGPDRLTAADRYGVGGRGPNREFFEFLIPGVRGVPVGAFVALITLFALGIGPVNYLLLKRRHRLGRLAVTVPLIAAGTAAALLGYSLVMHGFAVKARELAVTVHDPGTDRAVTFARTAVFAPRTPAAGLTFAPDAAVLPLAPPGPARGGTRVDWTDGQTWGGDAFRGRTRTQFVTVAPRPERGRLTVSPSAGGTLTVTNGYDTDFSLLTVSDAAGALYAGRDVPAGGSARLAPAEGEDLFAWRERLDPTLPELPPGMEASGPNVLGQFAPMLAGAGDTRASFRASLAYRTAALVRGFNEQSRPVRALAEAPLAPVSRGTFVALLAEPEEAAIGGLEVAPRGGAHLLIGVPDDGRVRPDPPAAERSSEPAKPAVTVRRPGGDG